MSYKTNQDNKVEYLIQNTDIFQGDAGNGYFMKAFRPFILENANHNIYPPIFTKVQAYFKENHIGWWGGKLTNHPLSSQIACINHLFSIRKDKQAVLAILKQFEPEIEDVLVISTDDYEPAYIQFEAVSDTDHLNEMASIRGSNCTSIDALIFAVHANGQKILFPIEWKYVEQYRNRNMGTGEKGNTRRSRYTQLIEHSNQLLAHQTEVYYFEPFYQLMRQTLWAEQMLLYARTETLKADDYRHIHVIPKENSELLDFKYKISGLDMEKTWRSCLANQNKYHVISPKQLMQPIDETKYEHLLSYLSERYW